VMKQDYPEAEKHFKKLLELRPDLPDAWFNMGIIAGTRKDMDKAMEYFEKALSLKPDYVEAITNLTNIYMFRKEPDKAIARLREAVAAAPGNVVIKNILGEILMKSGRFDEAREVIQKALAEDPKYTLGYVNMGNTYRVEGKLDDAETWYLKAVDADPGSFQAHLFLATLYEERKQYDKAIKSYEKAVGLNGDSAIAKNNLAYDLAEHGGNIDRALELAQSAKEQFPDNPSITDTLGWIYYKKNVTATAIELFNEAIHADPKNPTLHYHLALAYKKAGDAEKARQALTKALGMGKDFPEAEQARAELDSLKSQGG
jgi:tetratricopeptide (TPR) repeat protein